MCRRVRVSPLSTCFDADCACASFCPVSASVAQAPFPHRPLFILQSTALSAHVHSVHTNTQPPPLTGPRQPPRLNALPSLLPSSISLSLPAWSFLFFWLESSLENNVHCQRDVGGERRASRCVFIAKIRPAAPLCRRQALRLDKNLWLFGDNRLRSSLSAGLQGLFRSAFVNVVWLHPTGHFIRSPISNIKPNVHSLSILKHGHVVPKRTCSFI